MKFLKIFFGIVLLVASFAGIASAQISGGDGTINQLQQFSATTSPSAITQSVYGKPLKITGLNDGCLSLSSSILTSSGSSCGSGGAGSGLSTTTADYILYNQGSLVKGLKTSTNTVVSSNASADVVLNAIVADAPSGASIYAKGGTFYLNATSTFSGTDGNFGPTYMLWGDGVDSTKFVVNNNADALYMTARVKVDFRNFSIYLTGGANGLTAHSGASTERSVWKSNFENILITSTTTTATGHAVLMGNDLRNSWTNIQMLQVGNGLKSYAENSGFNNGDSVYSNVQCNLKTQTSTDSKRCYDFDGSSGGIVNQNVFLDVNASNDTGTKTAWYLNHTKWFKVIGTNNEGFATTTEEVNISEGNSFQYNYTIPSATTGAVLFSTDSTSIDNSFGCAYVDTPAGSFKIFSDANTDANQPNTLTGINGNNCKVIGLGTVSISTTTASIVSSLYNTLNSTVTNQSKVFSIPVDGTTIPAISVGTGANVSNYVLSYAAGRGMLGYDLTKGDVSLGAGNQKGLEFWVNGTNNSFLSGTQAMKIQGNASNGTVGSIGFGTNAPAEHLHSYLSTGYNTFRNDSGSTQGALFSYDGDNSVNVGSISNSSLNFIYNNSIRGTLYGPNSQGTVWQVQCPSGVSNCQEATFTTMLDPGTGNKEWVDWTTENYGVDHLNSINLSKAGTGQILPLVIRGWNQDLGQVHAVGVPIAWFDPAKGVSAIGNFASTTGQATNKYPTNTVLSVGASTTAAREFSIYKTSTVSDANLAFNVLQGGNIGIGTSTSATYGKLLDLYGAYPLARITNSDSTQFAGAGLVLANNVGTLGNQASTIFYSGINDGSATQAYFGIDQGNTIGGAVNHWLLFDYSAQKASFYTSGTEKLSILSGGNVGVGTTTPAFTLDVNGATNLEPISAPSTAYKGVLWNDSTNNQLAYTNGNTLYQGGRLYTATAAVTLNSATPTSALSATKVGTTTIAANSLKVGQRFTIWGAGYYSTPIGNTATVTITPSIASSTATNISTVTTSIFPASATNLPYDFRLNCTVQTIGALGKLVCDGTFNYATALTGVSPTSNSLSTVGQITFDSTANETLDVKVNWSAVTTQTATVQESWIDF